MQPEHLQTSKMENFQTTLNGFQVSISDVCGGQVYTLGGRSYQKLSQHLF